MVSINRSDIFLHIHERPEGAVFGLNMNFWYLDAAGEEVASKSILDMPIERWNHRSMTGVDTIEDYVKCEQETFSKNLNLSSVCWAPMFEAALEYATLGTNHSFRPCRSYLGFAYTYYQITQAMGSLGQDSDCTKPKSEVSFQTNLKESLAPIKGFTDTEGMTCVCIYYDTGELYIEEEYMLINLSSLLSSIGGIIGVILGWSLLHLVNFCLKRFYSK